MREAGTNLLGRSQHISVLFTNVICDAIYTLEVSATASVDNTLVPGAFTTAIAFADPQVSFAPGFNSTGFTLEFSPGIVNGPPRIPCRLAFPSLAR